MILRLNVGSISQNGNPSEVAILLSEEQFRLQLFISENMRRYILRNVYFMLILHRVTLYEISCDGRSTPTDKSGTETAGI